MKELHAPPIICLTHSSLFLWWGQHSALQADKQRCRCTALLILVSPFKCEWVNVINVQAANTDTTSAQNRRTRLLYMWIPHGQDWIISLHESWANCLLTGSIVYLFFFINNVAGRCSYLKPVQLNNVSSKFYNKLQLENYIDNQMHVQW